jgi:fibronectin-binding autotransporter adhesin
MPVTRIKNNQVTDASGANTQLGINANTKLQNYSITSTKIANNLVYGSDLTVTGNLTVQGNSTAIDTTITTIEDPIIVLASTQTSGAPAVDIGYLGFRGNQSNIAFVWDESAGQFVTAFTSTGESNTTITITSYANLQIGNLSLTGNILNSSLNVTGNITGGNLLTPGLISATSTITSAANITGGNILTGGLISATSTITSAANITGANIITGGLITATGNITGGNVLTAGIMSSTGNGIHGNILTGGLISAAGNITSGSGSFFIGNGSQLTGVAASSANFPVSNGTSNINAAVNANITVGVAGTSNVAVFASTGVFVTGVNSVTGNITGGNLLTGGLISATGTITSAANVTGANITTAGLITATGNINTAASLNLAGNIIDSGALTITTASGDITLNASGNINAGTNYINNVIDPVQDQDAATKIYVDNRVSTSISYHEAVVAATTGNLDAASGGTVTYAQPNGAANGIGATLTTTGTFNLIDTANVQSANTRILVKDQANAVQNGVYVWSNATVLTRASTENTAGFANVDALSINDYFFTTSGNVNKGTAFIVDAPSTPIVFGTSNIQFAVFSQTQVYSANTSAGISLTGTVFSALVDNSTTAFSSGNIVVKAGANLTTPNIGAATGTSLSVTGNVTGGNISTAGVITATGNITGGNLITGGLVSATGTITSVANITGGNVLTGGLISATSTITSAANITGGNLLTGGLISATGAVTSGGFTTTGNVTGGNILYGSGIVSGTGNVYAANFIGNISGNIDAAGANTQVQFNDTGDILGASAGFTFNKVGNILTANGNINGANLFTGGSVSATGNLTGANLVLTTGTIDGPAAGRITINGSDIDTDFAVDGDTLANVFYVDAGTGTASFGASTQVTNAIVNFATTTSIKTPVGNTAQRPGTGVTGMLRFNTTSNALEVYDNSAWSSVGVPVFTVIADQQFAGDGSTLAFTLGSTQTTNSCIVSINGVVQIPTLAYAVAGTDPTCVLTFTEAPAAGDVIDVRQITTTTTVTSIANSSGNAIIATSATAAQIDITGNVVPTANVTYNLGTTSLRWKDLFLSGNSITLGNTVIKNTSGNSIGFFGPNGTTPATIDAASVDTTTIANGTSNVKVVSANANITVSVAGTSNVAVFSTGGITVGVGNVAVGNLVNNNSNGVGNIGTTTTRFNQVFALASSAQYADLAEKYTADATYETGTVVAFGGTQEVTLSDTDNDRRVAGVISALPSFRMNDALESEYTAMVALTGRVPTKVTGTVRKGDMMVSAGAGRARSEANPEIGTVIGKALEDFNGSDGIIEVVVGRV